MNPHMAELGIEDSREEVLTYLDSLSHGLIDMRPRRRARRRRPRGRVLAGGEHARPVPDHQGLPRLPPRAPGREARRRPLARVPAVPVRRARRVAAPGHGRPAAVGQHHDERDQPGPRRPAGRRAGRARAAQDPRRARRRAGAGRPAAQGVPGPRHRAAHRHARGRADQSGDRITGVRFETADGAVHGRRHARRRPRHRRVRVGPRPGATPSSAARSCARRRCRPTPATA